MKDCAQLLDAQRSRHDCSRHPKPGVLSKLSSDPLSIIPYVNSGEAAAALQRKTTAIVDATRSIDAVRIILALPCGEQKRENSAQREILGHPNRDAGLSISRDSYDFYDNHRKAPMIAISYRREDSMPVAGRLYDRLEQRFGRENVFMDFDSIPAGVDFRDQIKNTIERSKVVIVVIGPNWLGQKSDGTRRIDDPADVVRLEVAHALQRGIPVIPVLVNNTRMPKPETLPIDIQALAFRQALPLDTGQDFRQHAERLMKRVDDIANKPPRGKRRFPAGLLALAATAVVLLATIVVIWVKACTPHPPGGGSETSQANTTPSPTPSKDRDKPTQLTSSEIKGKGVGEDISYYYKFNAGPGEVTVTVGGKNKPGLLPLRTGEFKDAVAVEISDLDEKKLFYVERDLTFTTFDERKVERFQLDHRQPVIMRILLSKHILDYMVRVEGPGFSPATKVQGPQGR